MNVVAKAGQVMLGAAFLGAGAQKLTGADQMVDEFARFRYPPWFRVATGAVEVSGAMGMLLGLTRPVLVPVAGLLLAMTMGGAIITRARFDDPLSSMARPAVLMILALAVAAARLRLPGGVYGSISEAA